MSNLEDSSFLNTSNNFETKNSDNKEENNLSISTIDQSHSFASPKKIQESSPLIPIEFIWSSEEKSKEVLLSCSYLNWSKTYLMKPDQTSKIFKYILSLPEGKYEYKFIVDGKSCIMENQPKNSTKDKNNFINNLIIVKKTEKNNSINDTNLTKKNVENKKVKESKKEIEIYDCSKNPSDFNLCTPSISQCHCKLFEFKDEKERISDTYIKVKPNMVVPNVFISHLMITKKNEENSYSRYSVTNRAKKKMVTIVYYQPLSKK